MSKLKEITLLDGKYKIYKMDELNWTIKVKSDAPSDNKDYVSISKTGKKTVYNAGGYKQYSRGVYFNSLKSACEYFVKNIAVEENDAGDVNDLIQKLDEMENRIVNELSEQLAAVEE